MWESLTTKHGGGGMGSLLNKTRHLIGLYDVNETSIGNHAMCFAGIIMGIKQAGFIISQLLCCCYLHFNSSISS
jgi:hypothetical protein